MDRLEPKDHGRRMDAARARAQWELGDATWADTILRAYLDPDRDSAELRAEQGE